MMRYILVFSVLVVAVAGTALGQELVTITWDGAINNPPNITTYLQGTPMNTAGNWHESGVEVPPYQVTISGDSLFGLNGTRSVYCIDLMSGVGNNGNYTLSAYPTVIHPLSHLISAITTSATQPIHFRPGASRRWITCLARTTLRCRSASRALALAAWALVYDDPGATLAQFQSYGVI